MPAAGRNKKNTRTKRKQIFAFIRVHVSDISKNFLRGSGHTRLSRALLRFLPGSRVLPSRGVCYTLVLPEYVLTGVSRVHQHLRLRISRGVLHIDTRRCIQRTGAVLTAVKLENVAQLSSTCVLSTSCNAS